MRRPLVWFLATAAAVLSFDALRSRALESGLVPAHAILPADLLASLWALVIDVAAAAGLLGVRSDRRDLRAWAMVILAFGASVLFQIHTPSAAVARAVPPVALATAVVVLELPRRTRDRARAPHADVRTDVDVDVAAGAPMHAPRVEPAHTRARTDAPRHPTGETVPAPGVPVRASAAPTGARDGASPSARNGRGARVRTFKPLSPAEQQRVRAGLARGRSGAAIAKEMGINVQRVRAYASADTSARHGSNGSPSGARNGHGSNPNQEPSQEREEVPA